jgi:hypothetical protein
LGSSLGRIASFAWNVPDNDNVARGNAMVYPDRFPMQRKEDQSKQVAPVPNVTPVLAAYFDGFEFPERAVLFYAYAVLSCPSYLNSFEPVLYVSSDPSQPFRIPIAKDIKIRALLVELGRRIAECESNISPIKVSPKLEAEWPRDISGFKLKKDVADQISGSISLLDENQNTIVSVKGITARCLSETISGHHVLTKWLRERTYAYVRREFRKQDLDEFLQLISRIEEQHVFIDKADKYVAALIAAGVDGLIPSSAPESSGVSVEFDSSLSGGKGAKKRKRVEL